MWCMVLSGSRYQLDELGWLQFDRLAELVLDAEAGLSDLGWRGDSDIGRMALVGGDVVLAQRRVTLHGPVSVAVVWVPEERGAGSRVVDFVDRTAGLPIELDGRLLVLTNLAEAEARKALRNQAGAQLGRVVVLGAREIGAILDRHPGLRAAMPSVLGLRDLGDLIDVDVARRSSLDVGRAQELARVFWPTRAYDRAFGVLGRHRFVVLTGPPEMGKTAIAQMLALALMTDGWEAHECNDPEQVWRAFDPQRRQLFVADDAFGSTEYRPDAAERWARGLGRLLAMLDDQHWLIWTSRPAPLKAGLRRVQRERGAERFPAPGEVLVDASDLDLAEKTLILFRHAKDQSPSGPARELIRSAALTIVEHPHFTPERIRRFVTGRLQELPTLAGDTPVGLVTAIIQHELASPTDAMRTSFDALEREHRELLISLLDAPAGLIDERELAETVRRHHAGGLSRPPGELIDRLTDHFLRVTPLGIGWVHPSWRDLVIDQLRGDPAARQRFLSACGTDGLTLALSHAGGAAGERTLPLLIDDANWDVLADRTHDLLRELDDKDIARVLHALTGALSSVTEGPQATEAQTLATECLDTVQRAWNRRYRPVPLFLLEAWYALNAGVAEPLTAPDLGPTWVELHPGSLLLENPDRSELARAEEWLALAELLNDHDPAALEAFDFYGQDRDLLARAIATLARAAADPDLHDLAESVLNRIRALLPELGAGARSAIEIGRLVDRLESDRWWAPEDLAAPPTTDPVAAGDFTRKDVHRVLSDL
jgi:ribosomal protein L12E/L44/L45/RPP1/RPP2